MANRPSEEEKNRWHSDPSNWFLGIFYFNKEDKRLFPPKRISFLGWTINFANPFSILAMVCLCTVVVAVIKFLGGF